MPDTPPSPDIELSYSSELGELDALEPLWNALQAHHSQINPSLGDATPRRDAADAWRMRRSKYERWLQEPKAFFVVARKSGEPVGYAFVTVGPGYASWATGEQLAELETLSVLPDHRSAGTGRKLLDAVWARLGEHGVADLAVTTTKTNIDAQRFYERHGLKQAFVIYYGKSPTPPPS